MTVTWSTNETIINWTSSDDPAVTFQVVKIAGGTGGGGGGGVTDHGDLTGLADDDHDQYQYVNAVYTEADPFTITDESAVVTQGAAITLPSATTWQNRSVMIVAAAVDLTVTCHAGDTIAVTGGFSSTLSIPSQNIYQLTSTNFGGTWRWLQTARFGPAFDMPYWYGQSITQGHVIKMGASAPEWGAVTPGAHASTHGSAGSDPVTIAQSQVTNLTTDLGNKVPTTRTVSAGTGLSGGGDLSANRTLSVAYGSTAGTAAEGNDARLSDTRTPTDGSVSTAKLADSAVTSAKIADGTIVNADISASAAIATSKISGLAAIATSGSASDLASGTVPTARLSTRVVGGQDEGSQINEPSTATSLLDSTITLPACAPGDLLLVNAGLSFVQNSAGSRVVTLDMRLGSTTILSAGQSIAAQAGARSVHVVGAFRVEGTSDVNASMLWSAGGSLNVTATGVATENIGSGSLAFDMRVTGTVNTTQNYTLQYLTITRVAA